MAKKTKRKRHEKSLWKEFRFEIFIGFLFVLGVFLLVEEMEIKATLFHSVSYFLRLIANSVFGGDRWLRNLIAQVETSDIIGILLILTAIVLLGLQFRKKVIHRYSML